MKCRQHAPLPRAVADRYPGLARACGVLGVLGVLVFLGAVVVLHLARRDVSPVNGFVSDYANGRIGMLFTVAALTHGAGNIAIAVGLGADLGPGRRARWGVLVFGVASVGLLLAGIFRTDPAGAPASVSGQVHSAAVSVSFVVELVAMVMLVPAFRADPRWRGYARQTAVMAIVAGAATVWMLMAIETSWAAGLAERAALGVFVVWELRTAYRLASRRDGHACGSSRR